MIFDDATIITMDPKRRIITDGAIAVAGDRIVAVGKTDEIAKDYLQEERYNCRNKIVIPGLIDCHVHLAQALIRGCADDLPLIPWLVDRVWPLQGNFDEEDGHASAELCILEMLKSGTTAFVETLIVERYGFDGIAEVVQRSGIRGVLAKSVMDIPTYASNKSIMYEGMREDRDRSLQQALSMHEKWDGSAHGRIRVWFGPRPLGGSTPELLMEVSQLARDKSMGVAIHFVEIREDVDYIRRKFGVSPVELLEQLGLLGPHVLLIHAVWLGDEEIAKIARTGTQVVHNPSSNMKLASGFAKVPQMLEAGIKVSLGCDGGPSNNSYDMFREMKLAALIHKGYTLDPAVVPAEAVLEMATLNGATVMGMEKEIGSLEPGKKADLVVINLDKPHLTPSPNPVSTAVYCATGSDVELVMVDGEIVVRNGKILTLDEESVLRTARERAEKLYGRAGIQIKSQWPEV
jgi:cytosine/adenosine deaminase-related metal-dependent hydrolase